MISRASSLSRGHLDQFLAGCCTQSLVVFALRHKIVFKTIDGDRIDFLAQECLAFDIGDVTYGCKGVGSLCGQVFQRELGLYAETVGGILGLILLDVAI